MITKTTIIIFFSVILIVASIIYANMIDKTKDVDRDDVEFP